VREVPSRRSARSVERMQPGLVWFALAALAHEAG
jgi:hypothetical protein